MVALSAPERLDLPFAELAESPRWDGERLRWIDMTGGVLHSADASGAGHVAIELGEPVYALERSQEGGSLVVLGDAIARVADDGAGPARVLALPERPAGVLPNDSVVAPDGSVLIGFGDEVRGGAGSVLRFGADGTVDTVAEGLDFPNGLGFSPDGDTLYVVDSTAGRLFAIERGDPSVRRTVRRFDTADGLPDGLSVDRAGRIWVAVFDGGRIDVITPEGEPAGSVLLPVPQVSSCTFTGAGLDGLVVTTGRYGEGPHEASAGSLFRVAAGPGLPTRASTI